MTLAVARRTPLFWVLAIAVIVEQTQANHEQD
jgi:hypothetical protein